ncbi:MAG: RICIN domain-containing protein [Melioribacteraceae bacterium]|nr:RICIN domain-containing protein [Melioribacteraceae bacterium]MCF8264763.1 RICIN domain-containing protein [Melioribacteraceae bacterium]
MKQLIFLIFFGLSIIANAQFTGGTFSNFFNISTGALVYNPGGEAVESPGSEVAEKLALKVFRGYGRVPLPPLNPHFRCMPYEKAISDYIFEEDKDRNKWTFEHISDSQYVVVNKKFNVALTAKGETEIVPEPFEQGNQNQIFIISRVLKDFRYALYLKTKSGETAVTSNASGSLVYQRPFVKGNRNQMWVMANRYSLTSAETGKLLAPPEVETFKPGLVLEATQKWAGKAIADWDIINHPLAKGWCFLQHVQSGLFFAYPKSEASTTTGALGLNAYLMDYRNDYNLVFVFWTSPKFTKGAHIIVYPTEECMSVSEKGIIGEKYDGPNATKSQLWVFEVR